MYMYVRCWYISSILINMHVPDNLIIHIHIIGQILYISDIMTLWFCNRTKLFDFKGIQGNIQILYKLVKKRKE